MATRSPSTVSRRPSPAPRLVLACLLVSALWPACAGPGPLDAPGAGRTTTYEPGLPSFDLEAVATVRDGVPGLDLYTSIPRHTLVFVRTDSSLTAAYELAVRIRDERGRGTEAFRSFGDTLTVGTAEEARAFVRIRRAERIALGPGTYVAEVHLEDRTSGEVAVRRQRVEVFAAEAAEPRLSRPVLWAEPDEGGAAVPVVALHLPASHDSLQARAQVHGAPAGAALESVLVRLTADTTVAAPPYWLSPSRGSLVYRGVDDDPADTVHVARLPPAGPDVAVSLPDLGPGLYRLDLRLVGADGAWLAEQERVISVKGPAFPRLATLDALTDALAYIAYPRERAFILAAETPQERRARFDAFWGALVPDRRVAADLLRRYFERVEEANLLFSSHKAGWKTDRGMIYIVFGAPGYVEETLEGEVWHYDYSGQDPAGRFVFERPLGFGRADALGHLVLVRQPVYERAWTRAIDGWRRGAVR